MSRTYKDKYYNAYSQCEALWDEMNSWRIGDSKARKDLKQRTNQKLRRYKGDVGQGGWYKKPFCNNWYYW